MSSIDKKVELYMDEAGKKLAKKVQDNLTKITKGDKRMLAIRNYFHFSSRINTRWAMTSAEETTFKASNDFKLMEGEIKKIKAKFIDKNKKHKLSSHTKARSLQKQTTYWNGNKTVVALGANLRKKLRTRLKNKAEIPTDKEVDELAEWLKTVVLSAQMPVKDKDGKPKKRKDGKPKMKKVTSTTHATPGLSSHGRLRAIDFKIANDKGKIVAGTDTETAKTKWDDAGWTKKLKEAITDVSSNWDGPLAQPYEPWHWTYIAN